MEIINTGSTRVVLAFNKYVIKIPRVFIKPNNKFYGEVISFLEGWKANRYEYIWSKSKVYDFLCPVKYSFFFSMIIVMKKAEPLTTYMWTNAPLDRFKKFGGYEHKIDSFGYTDDGIVLIDYGN